MRKSIPILNLAFAYVPMYIVIEYSGYLDIYKSFNSPLTHGITACVYICAMLAYAPQYMAFLEYGDPWRHIRDVQRNSNEGDNAITLEDASSHMEEVVALVPSEIKDLQKRKKELQREKNSVI